MDDELAMLKRQLPSGETEKAVAGELPAAINMVRVFQFLSLEIRCPLIPLSCKFRNQSMRNTKS